MIIQKQYINKVGIDYSIIKIQPWDGEFYFEYCKRMEHKYTYPEFTYKPTNTQQITE